MNVLIIISTHPHANQTDYRKQFSDAFAMSFGQRFPKVDGWTCMRTCLCRAIGVAHTSRPIHPLHPLLSQPDDTQEGQCFDYYFDTQSLSFQPWATRVPKYVPVAIGGGPGETPFSQLTVPTVDTVRGCHPICVYVRSSRTKGHNTDDRMAHRWNRCA